MKHKKIASMSSNTVLNHKLIPDPVNDICRSCEESLLISYYNGNKHDFQCGI